MEMNGKYKVVDLFGNEEEILISNKQNRPNLFSDHDAFVEKFDIKKTTDDCYTPPEVYAVILDYVAKQTDLSKSQIIRPFFPGGDFEAIEYPENAVVIDNPPFSIIAKIARFYIEKNVPFFLFAPHLTLFASDIDVTHIVASADIRYENGAVVKTSFLSNMFGEAKIIGDPDLRQSIIDSQKIERPQLPKYVYPPEVLTVSMVAWAVEKGASMKILKKDAKHIRGLQSQKKHKKAIFGSGFLLSKSAAAEKLAAEKLAAEKLAAEKNNEIEWVLSPSEWEIINNLGK